MNQLYINVASFLTNYELELGTTHIGAFHILTLIEDKP